MHNNLCLNNLPRTIADGKKGTMMHKWDKAEAGWFCKVCHSPNIAQARETELEIGLSADGTERT